MRTWLRYLSAIGLAASSAYSLSAQALLGPISPRTNEKTTAPTPRSTAETEEKKAPTPGVKRAPIRQSTLNKEFLKTANDAVDAIERASIIANGRDEIFEPARLEAMRLVQKMTRLALRDRERKAADAVGAYFAHVKSCRFDHILRLIKAETASIGESQLARIVNGAERERADINASSKRYDQGIEKRDAALRALGREIPAKPPS